ncbi:MAG: M3 family oligoendopeptidase, partial [Firmicutes bacterium]|nr:M3 family oligoendopeptidase [Bacillota bacterium]
MVNANWKFSELEYKRPDTEELVRATQEAIEAVKNAKSGEEVLDIMMAVEERSKRLYTMVTIVNIRHTLDTQDEFYDQENKWIDETFPTLMPYFLQYNAAIEESQFRPYIEEKLGKQYFVEMDLQKKTFCEVNIPLMQQEAKLTDEYQSLMAACQVEFMGEKRNLYGIQKFFEHDDREVRRAAFKAYSDFYHGHEQRLEEIWDELIKIRNEMGRNLGYENYIPVGYMNQGRTDYGQEEVASFREQVKKELVPFCQKLFDAQAKRLGIDKVMAYDEKRVFPDGNATPIGDDDFMIEEARKMYHELSPETAEFIDFMIDHELMDIKNTPRKASTGYM